MAFNLLDLQRFTFSGDGKKSPTNWTKGEQIGCGAFSSVYLASVDSPMGPIEMVVKQIKTNSESKKKYEKSALTEINAMRNLSHERIVSYYGFCSKAFSFYVFMELVELGTLSEYIGEHGPMAENLVKQFTRQILEGLQYLHSMRMIHRDIKNKAYESVNDSEEVLKKSVRNPSESEVGLLATDSLFDSLSYSDDDSLINSVLNQSWEFS